LIERLKIGVKKHSSSFVVVVVVTFLIFFEIRREKQNIKCF